MDYIENLFSLKGHTAVVTGGAGAIGSVMSEALLRAGANVAVWSRSKESLASFSSRYDNDPEVQKRIFGVQIDTGEEAAVNISYDKTAERFGHPDILINGVGGNKGKTSFADIDVELFKDILNMNLIAGLVIPTKIFCRKWIAAGVEGTIINLASMASTMPLSGVWAYDAAKAATLNLTMAAANEFATYGIRVNAITPGFFLGKQNRGLLVDESTGTYTARGQAVINRTPFKRFGDVSELAGATLFLASKKASGFVTGISLPVDGGYLIHNI